MAIWFSELATPSCIIFSRPNTLVTIASFFVPILSCHPLVIVHKDIIMTIPTAFITLKRDNYDTMLHVNTLQAPVWEQKTSQYSLLEEIFHIHHTTCNRLLYIAELESNVAVEYTSFIRSIAIHNVAKQTLNHELHQVHQHKWIDDCKSICLSL